MWQLLIGVYFVTGAASYVLRRELAQRHPERLALLSSVFFLCFLLPTIFLLVPFFPHRLDVGVLNILLLLGGSIMFPLANITAFYANKHTDVGIFTVINNTSPIFTLLIALPFLNEKLASLQLVGIGLLVVSGMIAAAAQLRSRAWADSEGILFSIATAAILGIAIAFERFMLTRVDFGTYLIYGWGSQIVWSAILAGSTLKHLPRLFTDDRYTRNLIMSWGMTNVVKACAFVMALKMSGASIMSALTNFMAIAAVIAAYFYLKERDHVFYKTIAVGIGIGGLLLIAA